jgi:hypothetical protein
MKFWRSFFGVCCRRVAVLACGAVVCLSGPASGQSQWATGSSGAIYYNSGSIGVGTATPNGLLSLGPGAGIKQLVYDGSANYNAGFGIDLVPNTHSLNLFIGYGSGSDTSLNIVSGASVWPFTSYKPILTALNTGYVGIGTTTPAHLLQVVGTIGATEVIVSATGADYVFDPGYRLMPLGEVAAFIKANRHLPGIPPAAEVKEKGVSVGEMESKLLAKVEELTLQMIQMNEENKKLKERLEKLEKAK